MQFYKKVNQLSLTETRFITATACFFLTVFSITTSEVINRDGVTYLLAAQAFVSEGFYASQEAYKWPFYSIAIGSASILTGLSLENTANLINVLLLIVLTDSFVLLCSETNRSSSRYWISATVILAFTGLNDYKPQIIRDWGFLAFSLRAFVHLLKHIRGGEYPSGLLWQANIVIAALFRIEALVFMVLAPLISATTKQTTITKARKLSQQYSISALILILALVYLPIEFLTMERLEQVFHTLDNPLTKLNKHAETLAAAILNDDSEEHARSILLSGLIVTVLLKCISKLGVLYSALTLGGAFVNGIPKTKEHQTIYWLIAISLAIVTAYLTQFLIVTGRYVLLASILLLTVTTHYLEQWFEYLSHRKALYLIVGLILPMTIMIISGHTTSGSSNKLYIKHGGEWINENTPASISLLTNDRRLLYYSNRGKAVNIPLLHDLNISQVDKIVERYDYVALRNRGDISAIEELLFSSPQFSFKKRIKQEDNKYIIVFGTP